MFKPKWRIYSDDDIDKLEAALQRVTDLEINPLSEEEDRHLWALLDGYRTSRMSYEGAMKKKISAEVETYNASMEVLDRLNRAREFIKPLQEALEKAEE
jgi:hypothetical protein